MGPLPMVPGAPAQDWPWAMQLFQEMQLHRQRPTCISYNALIALVRADQALKLIRELQGPAGPVRWIQGP